MYNLNNLNNDLAILKGQGATIVNIGYTILGRPISAVHKGSFEGAQTLVQATIHAREWVTTPLVVELMKKYNKSEGIWCVPMVNIDGALLCQEGLSSVSDYNLKQFLQKTNGGSLDFSLWKANIRAVDLNVNFNANWGTGAKNIRYPSPENYIGQYPCSEPEVKALVDLTNRNTPTVTLSYHTQGNVIYKGFGCLDPYPKYAKLLAVSAGYPLLDSSDSAGGYKDWFVATTAKLGLTFECGQGSDYKSMQSQLPQLVEANKNIFNIATSVAVDIG